MQLSAPHPPTMDSFWDLCQERFRANQTMQQFSTWIKPLVFDDAGGEVRILAPNHFVMDWVREKFAEHIDVWAQEYYARPVAITYSLGKKSVASRPPQPYDDPATPIADDPTRDVVGNVPLLYADKRVVLYGDQGSPGIVDPGDVLRYTITVQNSAATPATGLVLSDAVPANTTYLANSTLLNGSPYGQPDGGTAPLTTGIDLGTLAGGASAVVQFDLRVNAGTPTGTVISNQAVVRSVELPNLLTDGDGNPATGPEPKVVVVGDAQRLSISKEVTVVGGGPVEHAVKSGATIPLPKNQKRFKEFVKLDDKFHHEVEVLVHAAEKGRMVAVKRQVRKLLDACTRCHSTFWK